MECVFCKIISNEIKSHKVYEDEKILAFLDAFPRSKGMSIIAPKLHFETYEANEEIANEVLKIAFKLKLSLQEALNPSFVAIAYMPSEVKHFHVRLYPFYQDQVPLMETKPISLKEQEMESLANLIKEHVRIKRVEEKKEEGIDEKTLERLRREWLKA